MGQFGGCQTPGHEVGARTTVGSHLSSPADEVDLARPSDLRSGKTF